MTSTNADDRKALAAADWIDGALAVLSERGVAAMKVAEIAAALGVTKGSFYWHFRDRSAFRRALAERWAADWTSERLSAVSDSTDDPSQRIRLVREQGIELAPTDRAMRAWASDDHEIATAVSLADRRVHSYLQDCFRDLGFDESSADLRARTLLYAFVGQYEVRLEDDHGGAAAPERSSFERLLGLLVQPTATDSEIDRHQPDRID